eukprot:11717548-Alexandrium_andersonii.AAC.1
MPMMPQVMPIEKTSTSFRPRPTGGGMAGARGRSVAESLVLMTPLLPLLAGAPRAGPLPADPTAAAVAGGVGVAVAGGVGVGVAVAGGRG